MRLRAVIPGSQPQWHRSEFCVNSDCVEVANLNGVILLRNSTRPRKVISYTPDEWRSFVRGVEAGNFTELE
jgi:hypothetical protein